MLKYFKYVFYLILFWNKKVVDILLVISDYEIDNGYGIVEKNILVLFI